MGNDDSSSQEDVVSSTEWFGDESLSLFEDDRKEEHDDGYILSTNGGISISQPWRK